jgi:acetamidase/formamidase
MTPYDIQAGRILGLVDIIPMNADRQGALMARAQEHAAKVFEDQDREYTLQAAAAVEAQLRSLLGLMGVELELAWAEDPEGAQRMSSSSTESPRSSERASVA